MFDVIMVLAMIPLVFLQCYLIKKDSEKYDLDNDLTICLLSFMLSCGLFMMMFMPS